MKQIILFMSLVVFAAGCKKSDPDPLSQLPAATHTGRNILGCLVNGQAFVVSRKTTISNPLGLDFFAAANTSWQVDGKPNVQHLIIRFNPNSEFPIIPVTYELAENYYSRGEFLNPLDGTGITGNNEFVTTKNQKGTLTLTHYTGKIAAGTFAFDAANDSGQVIHITDGRFDITL